MAALRSRRMTSQAAAKLGLHIAQRAAKLIAEDGITNYAVAKQKAAHQLGIGNSRNWPDNRTIDSALGEYRRLFQDTSQRRTLLRMRLEALRAMRLLAPLQPRLVGSVLSGMAGEGSRVCLHLITDQVEDLCRLLLDHRIPYQSTERRLEWQTGVFIDYPSYRFVAGDIPFELIVFPLKQRHQAPLDPLHGRPMRRADQAAVQALVSDTEE